MRRLLYITAFLSIGLCLSTNINASTAVHLAYHWHLHQPIYWPDYKPGLNRYQFGKESVDLKLSNQGNYYAGSPYEHPRNLLVNGDGGEYDSVFDKSDRIAVYQDGGKNSIATITGYPDTGVSVSYSGALQENIWSFGKDSSYGYGPNWNDGYKTAHSWLTSHGKPRCDLVGMTYHHAFSPLLPKTVLKKEIDIFKEIWWKNWGGNSDKSDHSKGFWPVEVAFSEAMIPVLKDEGYNWVIIANSHLARTCQNYMDVANKGVGGWNIDPPNKADVLGPYVPANQWYSGSRDARGGTFAVPYCYQAHKAKYVDPNTGVETKINVVPMCDYLSYENGYATMGTGVIDQHIAPFNDPSHPCIVLMAHDGDNAWGGGSSYYYESVPGLMNEAASKGYTPSSVEEYLYYNTPPDSDVVHVEDGAWVNAASDWGHPQFINWLWPPTRATSDPGYTNTDARTWYDLESPGWTEDWRNWAVLIAGANICETGEQIWNSLNPGNTVQAWRIQEPYQKNGTYNNLLDAERAWHMYLGGLDSGFMYYGTSLDDEVKQSLACNRASAIIKPYIDGHLSSDTTPPTVFKPQRFPWNPGGKGFGPLTGYQDIGYNGRPPWSSDFYIWTHVFDISGVTNVILWVRQDNDGTNPISSNQNETYAGGSEVGPWVAIPMTKRTIPKGNVTGNSQIDFFIQPDYIADYYFAKVNGYRDKLLDYYIEAVDSRGNTTKTDIQHVYVYNDGSAPVTTPATPTGLTATPVSTNQINLAWNVSSGATGYIVQRDNVTIGSTSTTIFWDLFGPVAGSNYCYQVAATNNVGSSAFTTNVCATTLITVPPQPPGTVIATALATNQIDLSWSATGDTTGYIIRRAGIQIATAAGTSFSDTGLSPSAQYCYTIASTNNAGSSAQSSSACATTFSLPLTVPATPTNLIAVASPNRIDLSWSPATNATGYIVNRGGSPIGTTAGTSFADIGLVTNTVYCYSVAATNAAGNSAFTTNVCALTPSYSPITIGAGLAIGTDKHGVTWYQDFQDWQKSDLRALDPNADEYVLNDGADTARDMIAFYSRQEGDKYYFRVDFFDLAIADETTNLNLYVAMQYTSGGQGYFPDNVQCNTDHPWNLCVKLYDANNKAIVTPSADVTADNWLGAYFQSQLDAVEFGIKTNAMVGWDGVSPVYFQVFTTKDFVHFGSQTDIIDAIGGTLNRNVSGGIGMLSGAIASTNTTGCAKYAVIAHANQSVNTRSGTQAHIYRNLGTLTPGFVRTLDTHEMYDVPLNMHISGTLLSSFLWAHSSDPNNDGPAFLNRVKNFVQSGKGSLIGGTYAENIMPYFEGDVNRASIKAFNELALSIFNLTTNDMKVMHTPERVMQSNTNWPHANPSGPLKGKPFEDILASGYVATYLDEVTHLHWWFYPGETNNVGWDENNWGRWAGGGGNDEEPYHHKIHKINGVLTFMINDREDQTKFGNDDGGMIKDTRYTLLDKALSSDQDKITIVFDDWEAYAGNSFGQGANNNADQYHNTIRWAANHPWIQIVNLKDIVTQAQSDTNWIIDHGYVYDKSLQTYEWLKHASEQDYDNWYYGKLSGTNWWEENFFNRVPGTSPSGWSIPGTKIYGDMNTPGTLLRDSWDKVGGIPAGNLRTLAEWTYSAMIYETAWHDENPPSWWDSNVNGNWFDAYKSRNYQLNFDRPSAGSYNDSYPNFDPTSGWAVQLHGHARKVGVLAEVANWVQGIKNGTVFSNTIVEHKDIDDDLWDEYILHNDKAFIVIKRWGARVTHAFVYDNATQDAIEVIGAPVANPSAEHDGEGADVARCSAFKDRWAGTGPNNTRYIDSDYALTAPTQGADYWEFVSEDGQIRKRITLPAGRDAVRADYTLGSSVGTLYLRHGFGPNQNDLLKNGDSHLTTETDSAFYYGVRNTQGGAVYAITGTNNVRTTGTLPQAGYQNRELPLVEQVELYNTATNFSTWIAFSLASAQDADGDGIPNATEIALGSDPNNADTDGDGMSDGFEYNFFGNPTNAVASADADGDGMSNVDEYRAGTNPNDASSMFRITSIAPSNSMMVINWNSVPGKRYQVYFKDGLTNSNWLMVAPDSYLAGGTNMNYTTGGGYTNRYYKVGVIGPP